MNKLKHSGRWTNEEFERIIKLEHIRHHLIQEGFVNAQGDILTKEEYQRRQRSRQKHSNEKPTQLQRKCQSALSRPQTRTSFDYSKYYECHRRSRSPGFYPPLDRRLKRSSIPATRPSSVLRRSSPSPLEHSNFNSKLNSERTIVTMIYYGPQLNLDAKRSKTQPKVDDILITQQHNGGENLVVFKGRLKPNDTFEFESRRHSKFPFALAFYINGMIDHRLSICCEWRHRSNVRLGGKRGLFGIIHVRKAKACRRCRIEQRTNRLAKQNSTPIPAPSPAISPNEELFYSSTEFDDHAETHRSTTNQVNEEVFRSASQQGEFESRSLKAKNRHHRRSPTNKEEE